LRPGTLRYYGTPAEEGGSDKVYMVRAGLFNDVDAVVTWHPGDRNEADSLHPEARTKLRVQNAARG
jgi:aminobenzoyl-glutamate utilization protein B